MSKVSAESGQAAWYGTWPETARGSGNTATLCTAIANCANLQEGFTPRHEPWAQCWHPRLPASLATTRPPCGSSGASHELFWVAPSSFCPLCLRRGVAVLAPSEQPQTTLFAAAGARVFVCQSNSHSLWLGGWPWGRFLTPVISDW